MYIAEEAAMFEEFMPSIAEQPKFCLSKFCLAITGAFRDDNDHRPDSGATYLFDSTAGVQIAELLPADFDSDGSVGPSDLLALRTSWAPCP